MTPLAMRVAVLTALCGLAAPVLAATSTFDLDSEGWGAQGDLASPLSWLATGGNPAGHVMIDDLTTGGVTYFVAPAKFLGNQNAALGTLLTFDLMQVYPGGANQFDAPDVALTSGSLTLVYDTAANPTNGAWTSYAVPLSAGDWKVGTLAGATATAGQMSTVLGNLTALKIRAEYQTGSDFGHLDNVALVPEPASVALLLAGLGAVGLAVRRQHRRAG